VASKALIIVENSSYVTGAFKSAITQTHLLRTDFEIRWVIPVTACENLKMILKENGIDFYQINMIEIRKTLKHICLYIPFLVVNTIRLKRIVTGSSVIAVISNDYYNLTGALLKLFGWGGDLYTYVRLLPNRQNRVLNKIWIYAAFAMSTRVIAVSQAVADQLPKSRKLIMIYDSVNLEQRKKMSKSPPKDDFVHFLYLANYVPGKGHNVALEAFAITSKKISNVRLKFVGSDMGLNKNKILKKQLLSDTQRLKISHLVDILGEQTQVDDLYQSANAVLNFSESESFSYTCLEGSMFGLPVIATSCGGPDEIILDGITGFLVPVNNLIEISDRMIKLAESETLRLQMGDCGAKFVALKFGQADKNYFALKSVFYGVNQAEKI
jgi:glycosyltransferase involved in cell wall biosynthesis